MDVVERLRQFGPEWSKKFGGHIIPYEVCVQAADEIERLRALIAECQFRIYGAGVGRDDLFPKLYAVTRKD